MLGGVQRIKSHTLAPKNLAVHGFIYDYDAATGPLNEVTEPAGKRATGSHL